MARVHYCYQTPTSELKIWGERSPLSTWTDKVILKNLKFQLVLTKRRLIITGDQTRLETLIYSLQNYIHRFLVSPDRFTLDHHIRLAWGRELQLTTLELGDIISNLDELAAHELLPFVPKTPWIQIVAAAIATVSTIATVPKLLTPQSPQLAVTLPSQPSPNPEPQKVPTQTNSEKPAAQILKTPQPNSELNSELNSKLNSKQSAKKTPVPNNSQLNSKKSAKANKTPVPNNSIPPATLAQIPAPEFSQLEAKADRGVDQTLVPNNPETRTPSISQLDAPAQSRVQPNKTKLEIILIAGDLNDADLKMITAGLENLDLGEITTIEINAQWQSQELTQLQITPNLMAAQTAIIRRSLMVVINQQPEQGRGNVVLQLRIIPAVRD